MIDFDAIMEKHKEVRRKQEALYQLRARATDTSAKLTGMPGGGGDGKREENAVVNIVDMESAYLKAYAELKAMKRELRPHINRLQKWQYREAMKKRYLDGKSIQRVADEIGYEYRQTVRFIDFSKEKINAKMS